MPSTALFRVKRSPISGLGLYATADIGRGVFLCEYIGDRITHTMASGSRSRYLFTLNRTHAIDGSSRRNVARYFNHSCRPNCKVFGGHALRAYTSRRIRDGEELTINYGREYCLRFIPNCKCGACAEVAVRTANASENQLGEPAVSVLRETQNAIAIGSHEDFDLT